jgi:glycine/sarcosine N-methyltransferase
LSPVPLYDALAADYDRFVNWEGRLKHELPFLLRLFESHGVDQVLDAACGTGQHAIALAQRGYRVTGTDLSAAMVEQARENASQAGVEVRFEVAGLGQSASLGETYDAALCLGNSLPHLLTAEDLEATLADFAAVLRPGGLLVVQNRNFDKVWAEKQRFMEPQSYQNGEGEWIFVRFYDFHELTVTFNMLRLRRDEEGWRQEVDSTELRPIFREGMAAALARAGFGSAEFYGGYDGFAYDPAASGDLLTVAVR